MTGHAVIQEGHRQQPQLKQYMNGVKTIKMQEKKIRIEMTSMLVELHDYQ